MTSNSTEALADRVLAFFNTVNDPFEIRRWIKDDPNFSQVSTSGYGISLSVAKRILAARDKLPGQYFASIRQIDKVPRVGPVTLHNILFSFLIIQENIEITTTKVKFRVSWDGKYIPGIYKVSELRRATEAAVHRESGYPSSVRLSPTLTSYEPIVLRRSRTDDMEFEKWAKKVWDFGSGLGAEISLKDFRKDITIELQNEAGQCTMAYKVYRCWPSEYVPISAFNVGETSPSFESITLQHEGWERDYQVGLPEDHDFTETR